MSCLDKEFPDDDLINKHMHLDVPTLLEKLGTKGAAQMFLKAQQLFLENRSKESEEDRPKPMTAAEWRRDFGMEEEEGEEEEFIVEDEEEELEDDDEIQEPPSKKAKKA